MKLYNFFFCCYLKLNTWNNSETMKRIILNDDFISFFFPFDHSSLFSSIISSNTSSTNSKIRCCDGLSGWFIDGGELREKFVARAASNFAPCVLVSGRKPGPNFEPSFASLANWNFDGSDRILLINWKIENKVVSPFPFLSLSPHFFIVVSCVKPISSLFWRRCFEEIGARFETCLLLLQTKLKIGSLNTKVIAKIEIEYQFEINFLLIVLDLDCSNFSNRSRDCKFKNDNR